MKLEHEDIGVIAERLPELDAYPKDIVGIAKRLEDPRRAQLFASAAYLQHVVLSGGGTIRIPPRSKKFPFKYFQRSKEFPFKYFPRSKEFTFEFLPRTREITFGFIPIDESLVEMAEFDERYPVSRRFTFGVSVHVAGFKELPPQRIAGALRFENHDFPVVVTYSQFLREGIPPHPGQPTKAGSSTCWARSSNNKSSWEYGVMTARHVVEHLAEGDDIDLDPSTSYRMPNRGRIADLGASQIDASIIEIAKADWPNSLSPLALAGPFPAPIAPGDDVQLDGRFTSAKRCKTLSHHPLPHYWGSMMGQRLVIDGYGQGGDSGGLVTDVNTGNGIGLYMGRIDDGAGGQNGLCQDLYQASEYLQAELYI